MVLLIHAEQPERSLLLEVERSGRWRLEPADPPAQLGDLGADLRIREHPDPESQRGRTDVIPALDRQAERRRREIGLRELPMPGARPACPSSRPACPSARTACPAASAAEIARPGTRPPPA
jgi:hypothetical protein